MLVNKRINDLAKFTAKDNQRPVLQRICVSKDEVVATNGHVLAIMPVDKNLSDEHYPSGHELDTDIDKPILLTTDQIKGAVSALPKKPRLPILNNIQIGTKDGIPVINAGLPVVQISGNKSDDTYPDYKQVLLEYDDAIAVTFALDGKILKRICELAVKHGDSYTHKITFQAPAGNESMAIKWEIKNDDVVIFHGVIMPLRKTD